MYLYVLPCIPVHVLPYQYIYPKKPRIYEVMYCHVLPCKGEGEDEGIETEGEGGKTNTERETWFPIWGVGEVLPPAKYQKLKKKQTNKV